MPPTARTFLASMLSSTCVLVCVLGAPRPANAQRVGTSGPARFDITVGGGVLTGVSLGSLDANIRANATALQDYRLFSTETTLRSAPVIDLRVAGALSGRLALEGQVQLGKPKLETAISNDVESSPSLTVSEQLTQMMLGGGVRVRLDNPRRPARTIPYVSGGAGVLRQAHESRVSTEQSPLFYVGGGVRRGLGARAARPPRTGLRVDAQLLMVKGGLKLDDTMTPQLSVTGGVFFSF